MNTFLSRLSNVGSFSVTMIMFMVVILSFLTANFMPVPDVRLEVKDVKRYVGGGYDYYDKSLHKAEIIKLKFDLEADMQHLFNWNTKQLFVYIMAEYDNDKNIDNKVIVWDRIITNPKRSHLRLKKHLNKYVFRDFDLSFEAISDAKLSLVVERIPRVGFFTGRKEFSTELLLPQI
ncbi:hypothetical protein BB560_004647 [Smittium megazygosporum]|uniref:Signal peptidase subunit 3 n=1 Tax=Smittium megazygosporum TaxID=133381 RepID=A0A2T9Z8U0_9FUNG|nr:hypothetical protein BB560_004647 [Smittium megazygosporum]